MIKLNDIIINHSSFVILSDHALNILISLHIYFYRSIECGRAERSPFLKIGLSQKISPFPSTHRLLYLVDIELLGARSVEMTEPHHRPLNYLKY